MIRRATLADKDFVTRVYTSNDIWDRVTDDFTPDRDIIDLSSHLQNPMVYMLIPDDIGVIMFHPVNTVLYMTHASILPEHRGKKAIEAGKEAGLWMFHNTPCQKIFCLIPQRNFQAIFYARALGFSKEGVMTKAMMKHGELVDLHCYGIERRGR